MKTVHVPPSLPAARALVAVRLRMSAAQCAAQPLTQVQGVMLAEYINDIEINARVAHLLLGALGSSTGMCGWTAKKLVDAVGMALFDRLLAADPDTVLLDRFVNCAWRYKRSGWHERAVAAWKAREERRQDPLAKAA